MCVCWQQVFTASDRAGLIDNAFNLARASLIEYSVPLRLSLYLEQEDRYTPWRAFDMSIGYIRRMLVTSSHYGQWQVLHIQYSGFNLTSIVIKIRTLKHSSEESQTVNKCGLQIINVSA